MVGEEKPVPRICPKIVFGIFQPDVDAGRIVEDEVLLNQFIMGQRNPSLFIQMKKFQQLMDFFQEDQNL